MTVLFAAVAFWPAATSSASPPIPAPRTTPGRPAPPAISGFPAPPAISDSPAPSATPGFPAGPTAPAAGVPAVRPDTTDRGALVPDPEETLDRARSAQARFERVRRRHFPRTWTGPPRRCDEIVGRYCLWHDDEDWIAPAEEPKVGEARRELLRRLEELARRLPAEPGAAREEDLSPHAWIAGQRVRYLAEEGRLEEASRVAEDCRAPEAWWCRSLAGFVRHLQGEDVGAEAAFDAALAEMSREERCRWRDIEPLLDGAGRDLYGDLSCEERVALEARFWWLADPLHATPGNERRAEHFARRVMDRMQGKSASGYGGRWGDDLRELLVRYGWPAGWERARPRPGSLGHEEVYVAHDPPRARRFAPRGEWLAPGATIEPGDRDLDPRKPRSHYALDSTRIRDVLPLEHQAARFRRGEDVLVVAAWTPDRDTLPPCDSASAMLVVGRGPGDVVEARWAGEGGGGAVMARIPARLARPSPPRAAGADAAGADAAGEAAGGEGAGEAVPLLLSLESVCPSDRMAAGARYTISWPDAGRPAAAVSDLLLTAPDPLPGDLAEAAAAARGSLRVAPGERVGVYWEVYPRAGDIRGASTTLTLARKGKGFFRKLAEAVGLAGEREPSVGLRWRERTLMSGVEARAVAVTLPELDEGEYRLTLRVEIPGSRPLETSRPVRVEDGE